MNFLDNLFPGMNRATKTALVFVLSAVVLFSVGFLSGVGSNINATIDDPAIVERIQDSAGQTQAPAPTQAPSEAPTQAPSEAPTQTPTQGTSEAPATQPSGGEQSKSLSTPAEIIAYYNEAANKVKTNATQVTRNWEDLHSDDEYLEVPSALEAIGKTLMNTFLKKDETPIVWNTKDDIIANFPVKGQQFGSNATEADLTEATCTDDGTYYNITLKFKDCTDPQGTGCDAAFNIMKADDVYSAAKVVQNFSVDYHDAVIECKIEKATGNLVWSKHTLPMIMHVTAKVIVSLDAQVGMTFIDDYSVTY